MIYKIEENSMFKVFYLKRKLKSLESKRSSVITEFILTYPEQAARMDDVAKYISSTTTMKDLEFKIKAVNRLLSKVSNN